LRLFSESDGVFDVFIKLVTVIGIAFGAWAYFHTVHPVFEKELELQVAQQEKQALEKEIKEAQHSLSNAILKRENVERSLTSLSEKEKNLQGQIVTKEAQLLELSANLEMAETSAVTNKIQYYSDKILSGYLIHISSLKQAEFDVITYSDKLLKTHSPDQSNPYDVEAYRFFQKHVEEHRGQTITGDKIVEFSVSLLFDYKIEYLKKQNAKFNQ